jgi:hypothetical protein
VRLSALYRNRRLQVPGGRPFSENGARQIENVQSLNLSETKFLFAAENPDRVRADKCLLNSEPHHPQNPQAQNVIPAAGRQQDFYRSFAQIWPLIAIQREISSQPCLRRPFTRQFPPRSAPSVSHCGALDRSAHDKLLLFAKMRMYFPAIALLDTCGRKAPPLIESCEALPGYPIKVPSVHLPAITKAGRCRRTSLRGRRRPG